MLTLGRDTAGLLVGLGLSARAQEFLGRIDCTVSVDQGLLALHHAGASALAQFFDQTCGNRHHDSPDSCTGGHATHVARKVHDGTGKTSGLQHAARCGADRPMKSGLCVSCRRQKVPSVAGVPLSGICSRTACRRGFARRAGRHRPLATGLARGRAVGIKLDKIIFTGAGRDRRLAGDDSIGNRDRIKLGSAHGVVVAGHHVLDTFRRGIGIDDTDHRDAEDLLASCTAIFS
jgi:hypothetical protein